MTHSDARYALCIPMPAFAPSCDTPYLVTYTSTDLDTLHQMQEYFHLIIIRIPIINVTNVGDFINLYGFNDVMLKKFYKYSGARCTNE